MANSPGLPLQKNKWVRAPKFQQRLMSTRATNSLSSSNARSIWSPYPTGWAQHSPCVSENSGLVGSLASHPTAGGTSSQRGCVVASSPGGKSPSEEAIIDFITVTIPLWKSIRFPLRIAAQEQPVTGRWLLSGACTWKPLGRAIVSFGSPRSPCVWEVTRDTQCQTQEKLSSYGKQSEATARPFIWRERVCGWLRPLFAWGRGQLFHKNCSGAVAVACTRWLTHDRVLNWQVVIQKEERWVCSSYTETSLPTRHQ